jgi:ribosomal-protein-alanine N-acetyltransferase
MANVAATRPTADRGAYPTPRASAAAARSVFTLRAATPADVPVLEALEREAFPGMEIKTPFRREVKRDNGLYLVAVRASGPKGRPEDAGEARRWSMPRLWRRLAALALFERAVEGPRPPDQDHVAGVIGVWFVLDECHLVMIATRLEERRRGAGELMLIGAVDAALARGSRVVTLEVRASNEAARSLYRKYGFQDAGLRKRYYSDNKEDAVIMTTLPIQSAEYRIRFEALVRDHAARWGHAAGAAG